MNHLRFAAGCKEAVDGRDGRHRSEIDSLEGRADELDRHAERRQCVEVFLIVSVPWNATPGGDDRDLVALPLLFARELNDDAARTAL
jgi:hypothetical protein